MPLRRFTPRESVVNLGMVAVCEPIYHRREWATRDRLDAFALRRAVDVARPSP